MPNEPTKPMTWEEAFLAHFGYEHLGSIHAIGFHAGFHSRDAEVEALKADLRTALDGWATFIYTEELCAIRNRWSL